VAGRAKVEPITRKIDGEDPRDFVWTVVAGRRNSTAGQLAAVYAKMYPEPESGNSVDPFPIRNQLTTTQKKNIACARTVLASRPELAVGAIRLILNIRFPKPVSCCDTSRRHMKKSAQAIAIAMMYPETEQGKRSTSLKIKEVNSGYISMARLVLRYQPALADGVLAGDESLTAAYEDAKLERHRIETEDERTQKRIAGKSHNCMC